jgi:hypothetical protein
MSLAINAAAATILRCSQTEKSEVHLVPRSDFPEVDKKTSFYSFFVGLI